MTHSRVTKLSRRSNELGGRAHIYGSCTLVSKTGEHTII
jgi:hypothetical protein